MGEISRSAEKVIVTSDNVRFEKGEDIISEILSGNESALAIKDRRNALEYAIDTAEKGDVILITGKGHEHYEIVKNRKISFSEREIIRDRIKNKEM
jgi:UDP-N-acetylmuramoyl-L-alanyl-D-glutamate--2,6-diaminopimelate ligase